MTTTQSYKHRGYKPMAKGIGPLRGMARKMEMFRLREENHLSPQEIAEMSGLTLATTRTYLNEARAHRSWPARRAELEAEQQRKRDEQNRMFEVGQRQAAEDRARHFGRTGDRKYDAIRRNELRAEQKQVVMQDNRAKDAMTYLNILTSEAIKSAATEVETDETKVVCSRAAAIIELSATIDNMDAASRDALAAAIFDIAVPQLWTR
jgi:hypothetical protein